ncbi:MAG: ECF transporter S component [Oscillospiraceae bacterium]|nr:ECF transporter S component [Oscillospiraceae bacterium]
MVNGKSRDSLRKMTGLSIFTALIAVLTVLCTFVRFGPFSITLALAPIIIGGAMYGMKAGAYLGGVFGFIVLLTGVFGWDGGTIMLLMGQNALGCIAICIGKGIGAGWAAAAVYRAFGEKHPRFAVILASIVCPVVNTGLFIAGMMLFFMSTLEGWAGGMNVLYFAIIGLTGVNFLVELAVNLLLSSTVTGIIRYGKGRRPL